MTPLHLELMLHYYACREKFPREHAPAVVSYTAELIEQGLLRETGGPLDEARYCATEKGRAYVIALCRMPMPLATWIMPARDEEVLRP